MKIVINKCYGGFGLSPAGIKRYAELKGRKCYFFKSIFGEEKSFERLSMEEAKSCFSWSAFDIPNPNEVLGRNKEWHKLTVKERGKANTLYSKHSLYHGDIPRDDKDLIRVVEELGEKANGSCASLSVVEIPDGIKWEIDEYDGNESIDEKHRSWR